MRVTRPVCNEWQHALNGVDQGKDPAVRPEEEQSLVPLLFGCAGVVDKNCAVPKDVVLCVAVTVLHAAFSMLCDAIGSKTYWMMTSRRCTRHESIYLERYS
jgi:hypothetical protein